MKRTIYFFVALFALVACREEIIYCVTNMRPIVFSQQLDLETRAESLEQLNGKSFGVIGFKYDTKWESEQALATPDASWGNMKIDCDVNGICDYHSPSSPQNNGWEYWDPKKNYAFFGYYPYKGTNPDPSRGSITISGKDTLGAPIMTYILSDDAVGKNRGWLGSINSMHDVMYGYTIDANEKFTSSVDLNFHHCLYGVQIVAENFSDSTAIMFMQMKLGLRLVNRGLKQRMDGSSVEYIPFNADSTPQEITFECITNKKGIIVPPTFDKAPVDVSQGNHLLLVPQQAIEGWAMVTTRIQGEQPITNKVPIKFPNEEFKPGTRYVFNVQFVGDQINIIVIQGTSWVDKNTDIEFE